MNHDIINTSHNINNWSGKEFNFPFEKPYSIQIDLMKHIYNTLYNGKSGLFESPTGTGKSLSVICSSLSWLRDNPNLDISILKEESYFRNLEQNHGSWIAKRSRNRIINQSKSKDDEEIPYISTGIPWLEESYKKSKEQYKQEQLKEQNIKIEHQQKKLERIKHIEQDPLFQLGRKRKELESKYYPPSKKIKTNHILNELFDNTNDIVDQFLLENEKEDKQKINILQLSDDESNDDDSIEPLPIRKIYYCSRTHTQLNQFIDELKKTDYKESTKVVPLGSRKTHCINEKLQQLSLNQLNDQCITLKNNSSKKEKELSSCPYLKSSKIQNTLKDHILATLSDIEDILLKGRQLHACPYYGTRNAVPSAQLVTLPYNLLLHKNMRESLGISLRGNAVIIDEAHNLIESINSMYSVQLPIIILQQAQNQLKEYYERYKNKLKKDNLHYIEQLLCILSNIIKYISNESKKYLISHKQQKIEDNSCNSLLSINDFTFNCSMEDINLFHLEQFFETSDLCKKLRGFTEYIHSNDIEQSNNTIISISPMNTVRNFLQALTNTDEDGRILISYSKQLSDCEVKFILLNPEKHFINVYNEAHSVILLGGTLQPFDEYLSNLFVDVPKENIEIFTCSHVMPKDNLSTFSISKGPSNVSLNFNYQSRNNIKVINELGSFIANISILIPDGIVVFFPSYNYLDKVINHWKSGPIYNRILSKKHIFYESKSNILKDKNMLFESYKQYIQHKNGKGAILFSVVGGKMSEGINFSDELGRAVVMVGLPYPNRNDPLLQEKLRYIKHINPDEYYENMCMKAVNQSIGRSIRHQNDYGIIILLDERYKRTSIQNKLPKWIKETVHDYDKFGNVFKGIKSFFNSKK